jgi:hypothetical protein
VAIAVPAPATWVTDAADMPLDLAGNDATLPARLSFAGTF